MQRPSLVDIRQVNSKIKLDIVYATPNNFTNQSLYPFPFCVVHFHTASALNRVQLSLEKQGLGLKIFDGYRPLCVQQKMWDIVQDERFVSNPSKNRARHARGTAVDVTLVDSQGNELEMPTGFDDFTEQAHSHSKSISAGACQNRSLLQAAMKKEEFEPFAFEWWHFDLKGWQNEALYPVINLSFADLACYAIK
ncbi:M15 family metallopeptidase [Candidatus Protochlamydia phocaeensis]|uniref:M15 family metallopeptidase n=1 Tax=Candidatus Protochlamydia phocaeensis TaxID=1414722 RepID=UPI00083806DB|nr:M15 family metallopeptidase [Candidatus Protochlamydia phocaeensis]